MMKILKWNTYETAFDLPTIAIDVIIMINSNRVPSFW